MNETSVSSLRNTSILSFYIYSSLLFYFFSIYSFKLDISTQKEISN